MKICNEALWNFLFDKYGGDIVKRYYAQAGTYYTQLDMHYKQIPIVILPTDLLYTGEATEHTIKEQKV